MRKSLELTFRYINGNPWNYIDTKVYTINFSKMLRFLYKDVYDQTVVLYTYSPDDIKKFKLCKDKFRP